MDDDDAMIEESISENYDEQEGGDSQHMHVNKNRR